jgi:hypothetical protein
MKGAMNRQSMSGFPPPTSDHQPPDAPEMFDTLKLRLEKVLRLTNRLGWRNWFIDFNTSHIAP